MLLSTHIDFALAQLLDSSLPSTRYYWRRELGFPDAIVLDPRPLAQILSELNATGATDD